MKNNHCSSAGVAIFLAFYCIASFANEPSTASLPEFMWGSDPHNPNPVWVRADVATTPNGEIDLSLFGEGSGGTLLHNLNDTALRDSTGCTQLEEQHDSIPNRTDFSTLDKILSQAPSAIVGTVVASSFGFSYGTPGQAFELRIDEVIGAPVNRDHTMVFFPRGSFRVGKYRICKTDSRYANSPELGDRVAFFVDPQSALDTDMPLVTEAASLLVLSKDGKMEYPARLLKSGPVEANSKELLSTIRSSRIARRDGAQREIR